MHSAVALQKLEQELLPFPVELEDRTKPKPKPKSWQKMGLERDQEVSAEVPDWQSVVRYQ